MAVSKPKNVAAKPDTQNTDPRYKLVERALKRCHYQRDALIEKST
jgi:hypothetical protein